MYLEPCESELRPKQTVTILRKEASETEASLFRFSLAGAQWKLSARSAGRGLTTRAKSGGTSCIAKFHSPEYPGLPQCEFATMSWARAAGLCTPEFTLRHVSDFDQIPEAFLNRERDVPRWLRVRRAATTADAASLE